MPSKARKSLDINLKEIATLLSLHIDDQADNEAKAVGIEVLNKSAIVLMCAYWEAYCEDIAGEALDHIIQHAANASVLPSALKKEMLRSLNDKPDELEVWKIADEGWRSEAISRFEALKEVRDRKLNTPKSTQIDQLFHEAVGIEKISNKWQWSDELTVDQAKAKLNDFVSLRGSIAHRGTSSESVTIEQVQDYLKFIKKLAAKTGGTVNSFVKAAVGKPLWKK